MHQHQQPPGVSGKLGTALFQAPWFSTWTAPLRFPFCGRPLAIVARVLSTLRPATCRFPPAADDMRWWDGCDEVRCGFWVNFEGGAIYGSTLTLPSQWALIFTAFVALFIKLAGGYLWQMLCFALHQSSSSSRLRDDVFYQFQVIFRNTEHESSFIWNLHKVALAHRGARFKTYQRAGWLFALAALHGLGFSLAGGLSSRFIVASNEVQLIPGKCGWIKEVPLTDLTDDGIFDAANALVVSTRNGYRRSATYSRSCYAGAEGDTAACKTYVRPSLPYNTTFDAPCPFDAKICDATAAVLDTGFLRSDEHLGINTRPEDAMLLRKALTCVPLAGEEYTDGWMTVNSSLIPAGIRVKGYKFGDRIENVGTIDADQYTFVLAELSLQTGGLPYSLGSQSAFQNYSGDQAALFNPIRELQSTDADLSLVSLTNRVSFRVPVLDPWFTAQNCANATSTDTINGTVVCKSNNAFSFMGCQERVQICTADMKTCTATTGFYALQEGLEGLNPTQEALYRVLWKTIWNAQLNLQIGLIGRENLVANEYLWDSSFSLGLSANLPPEHWHHEVANWMNTSLAVMQRAATSFARPAEFNTGPDVSSLKYISEPTDPTMQLLCHRVKMRSAAFTSFSVLAVFLTFSFGLLIMAANGFVPIVVAFWQQRAGQGAYKRLDWAESHAFQLQRMAAEGRGIGPWTGKEDDVPRLSKQGSVFNLTSESLRRGAGGNTAHAYEMIAKEESSRQSEGLERVKVRDAKSAKQMELV
ncbi:hypothetical protein BDV95DRAFT_580055 [Massariosphaeria phaeospora]|uniref:Uncharacterized protein n=1 Tax=Massariosphaeria phaeospora TaxID=100035 RepID=A0A7C8M512_9PLEO|nr:hypothetical protein BDV95DRAFT_580055 [Massariosphaeria phaeospora]